MAVCQWILLLFLVFKTGVDYARETTLRGKVEWVLVLLVVLTFSWACGALSTIFGVPWELF